MKKTLREQVSSMDEIRTLFNEVVGDGFVLSERKVSKDHTVYLDIHMGEDKGDKIFFGLSVFDTPFENREVTQTPFGFDMPLDYTWPQRPDGHRSYIVLELQEKFNAEAFNNGDLKVKLLALEVDNVHRSIQGPVYLGPVVQAYEAYRVDHPRNWWKDPFKKSA